MRNDLMPGDIIAYRDFEGVVTHGVFRRIEGEKVWAFWGGKAYETWVRDTKVVVVERIRRPCLME